MNSNDNNTTAIYMTALMVIATVGSCLSGNIHGAIVLFLFYLFSARILHPL